MRIDARVPVVFGQGASPGAACAWITSVPMSGISEVLTTSIPEHAPDCACRMPRTAAGIALQRLFLRRAKGEAFDHVRLALDAAGVAAVRAALRDDPFASARFRAA